MTEIINLSISQTSASELSRQSSFGGSPGKMSIDLVEDKIFLKVRCILNYNLVHVMDPLSQERKELLYMRM